MGHKPLKLIALLAFCFTCSMALAVWEKDEGPRFGPEFTFLGADNKWLIQDDFLLHLQKHLIEDQPQGEKFFRPNSATFRSPEGWSFTKATDPGVFEFTMHPMTVRDFERYIDNIQDAIFVSAYNLGYPPQLYLGGGHINIDFGYFSEDPLLLRNFIVDFLNHNELSMGVWNYDTNNALHPLQSEKSWRKLEIAINEIDERISEFRSMSSTREAKASLSHDIVLKLRNQAYDEADSYMDLWRLGGIRGKHFAISFDEATRNDDGKRVEIRSVRPQESAYVWLNQIRLIRDRIFYLKTFNDFLPLKPRVRVFTPQDMPGKDYLAETQLNPPVEPQEALKSFYVYLSEAGHLWEDHRDYIWPAWIWPMAEGQVSERQKFEKSKWFLEHEAWSRTRQMRSCRRILES